jgi:hypothetical protein
MENSEFQLYRMKPSVPGRTGRGAKQVMPKGDEVE